VKKSRGEQGVHWGKVANGRICWSQAGVDHLAACLSRKNPPSEASAAPPAIPVPAVDPFVVVRARTPRVLHVIRPGELYDPLLPLNLWLPRPCADLFRPGMKVLGSPRGEHVWDFWGNPDAPQLGRRLPRQPGKW
jgi:hypothetical protein